MKDNRAIQRLRRGWASVEGFQWRVLLVLVVVAVALALVATVQGEQTWDAALLNLATELAGAAATYVLLQWVIGRRATKEELIAQMGSGVRDVAVPAADELRRRGWLTNGSLAGADLQLAQLQGANLLGANLERATLMAANLEQAFLYKANLEGAVLLSAHLERAELWDANLKGAELSHANLEQASVSVGQLAQAKSLAGATLPDGTGLSVEHWRAEFEEWRKKQEEQGSGQ
jgi:hypothetical protein